MYSKETKLLGLPQWEPKDHPDFLTDINGAFQKIDNQLQKTDGLTVKAFNTLKDKVEENTANISNLHSETEGLATRATKAEGDISDIKIALSNFDNTVNELDDRLNAEVQERQKEDAAIKVELESLEARVETNEDSLVTQSEAIMNLQTEQERIGVEQESQHTEIVNLQGDVNTLREAQETTAATVAGAVIDINDLTTKVEKVQDDVTQLTQGMGELSLNMMKKTSELEKKQEEHDTKFNEYGEAFTFLANKVTDDLTPKVTELDERVTALEESGGSGFTYPEMYSNAYVPIDVYTETGTMIQSSVASCRLCRMYISDKVGMFSLEGEFDTSFKVPTNFPTNSQKMQLRIPVASHIANFYSGAISSKRRSIMPLKLLISDNLDIDSYTALDSGGLYNMIVIKKKNAYLTPGETLPFKYHAQVWYTITE